MQVPDSCIVCNSKELVAVESYKHFWFSCKTCHCIQRVRREDYWLPKYVSRNFASRFLKDHYLNCFYPMNAIQEDESLYYQYYENTAKLNVWETKWGKQILDVKRGLKHFNIHLAGKNVVDISGGPGFICKELQSIAKRSIVTEYNSAAVDGMKKALEIEAVKYDYQNDVLADVLNDKFDVVLVNNSINFCDDLPKFVKQLRNICHSGAFVYITFTLPTLGCCLRWQHDEYTYNVLYTPEAIESSFSNHGFEFVGQQDGHSFPYMDNIEKRELRLRAPFTRLFKNKAMLLSDLPNKELTHKSMIHVYQIK